MRKEDFIDWLRDTPRRWRVNEGGRIENLRGDDPLTAVARLVGYAPTPWELKREREREEGHMQAVLTYLRMNQSDLHQIITACAGEETPDDPTLRTRILRACGIIRWPGVRNR